MAIVLKSEKGSALTHAEHDNNFVELDTIPNGKVFPSTKGIGIKLDTDAPDFGWHDLHGIGYVDPASVVTPSFAPFQGNLTEFQFAEGAEMMVRFHIPHDYAMGTNLFLHVHWTHSSTTLTGGSTTWGMEITYAKGHGQGVYPTTKTVAVVQNAELTAYTHMIAEGSISIAGGSATQLDTALMEPDGMLLCRFYLDSNDLTDSVSIPNPFVHLTDLHYQSTGIATKNREPDFWT